MNWRVLLEKGIYLVLAFAFAIAGVPAYTTGYQLAAWFCGITAILLFFLAFPINIDLRKSIKNDKVRKNG